MPTHATAKCFIAYCDRRKIYDFSAEMSGQITEAPRGSKELEWDCIFQPDGETETFSGIAARKREIAMRRTTKANRPNRAFSHWRPHPRNDDI